MCELFIVFFGELEKKDINYVLSIEIIIFGYWWVGVYIVDVVYFIKVDFFLDKEVCKWVISIYLWNEVVFILLDGLLSDYFFLLLKKDWLVIFILIIVNKNG